MWRIDVSTGCWMTAAINDTQNKWYIASLTLRKIPAVSAGVQPSLWPITRLPVNIWIVHFHLVIDLEGALPRVSKMKLRLLDGRSERIGVIWDWRILPNAYFADAQLINGLREMPLHCLVLGTRCARSGLGRNGPERPPQLAGRLLVEGRRAGTASFLGRASSGARLVGLLLLCRFCLGDDEFGLGSLACVLAWGRSQRGNGGNRLQQGDLTGGGWLCVLRLGLGAHLEVYELVNDDVLSSVRDDLSR